MKIHRFFVSDVQLDSQLWIHKPELLNQWLKVLRFKPGQQLVLFDGQRHDRLYKIVEINSDEVKLELITEFERKLPARDIYLFWSLLKKDKNDWVLQKCTELGVSHFVPLLASRSEKTGFNIERATKIITEAAEQCGRSDIPTVREPLKPEVVINQYSDKVQLLICEQRSGDEKSNVAAGSEDEDPIGVLVGPEGGWTDEEKQLFISNKLGHLDLHDFTLRAETACVAAVGALSNKKK